MLCTVVMLVFGILLQCCSDMPLDDTSMSEAALGAEKITDSKKQEKHNKISCSLCSCILNSEIQAQAHFSGVRHLKLLEKNGLPLPDNVSRDKLFVHQRKTHQSGIKFLKLLSDESGDYADRLLCC